MPGAGRCELPVVESLEGVVVHSSSAPVGEFDCSNPLFNRIRTLVRWAQRSNMMSVLTDCPHREKLGWLEQYHLNGPSLRYEFDLAQLFTKSMNDMADSQLRQRPGAGHRAGIRAVRRRLPRFARMGQRLRPRAVAAI